MVSKLGWKSSLKCIFHESMTISKHRDILSVSNKAKFRFFLTSFVFFLTQNNLVIWKYLNSQTLLFGYLQSKILYVFHFIRVFFSENPSNQTTFSEICNTDIKRRDILYLLNVLGKIIQFWQNSTFFWKYSICKNWHYGYQTKRNFICFFILFENFAKKKDIFHKIRFFSKTRKFSNLKSKRKFACFKHLFKFCCFIWKFALFGTLTCG